MNIKGTKWSKWKKIRQTVVKTIAQEYNEALHTSIFKEDKERVMRLKEALDFVNAFQNTRFHFTCPMCGSRLFNIAKVHDVNFDNEQYGNYPQYKLQEHYDELTICKCRNCGWYTIDEL